MGGLLGLGVWLRSSTFDGFFVDMGMWRSGSGVRIVESSLFGWAGFYGEFDMLY